MSIYADIVSFTNPLALSSEAGNLSNADINADVDVDAVNLHQRFTHAGVYHRPLGGIFCTILQKRSLN